jgi:hypothetical protein
MRIPTFAVLFISAAVLSGCSDDPKPDEKIIRTNYEAIKADFAENGLVADDKYKDAKVNIPVRFWEVTKAIGGITFMGKTRDSSVLAVFDNSQANALKTMRENDQFRMTCHISLQGTIYSDCVVSK